MISTRTCATPVLLVLIFQLAVVAAPAQETLERTINLDGGWVGYPGTAFVDLQSRFHDPAGASGIQHGTTFDLSLGLPRELLVGGIFAPESPTVPGEPDEWSLYARGRFLRQAVGQQVDLGVTGAYNGAAGSFDGEVALGRWFGPLRLLAAVRAMSEPYQGDEARFAFAGGAVVHPLRGSAPIALAADVGTLLDRENRERVAWSGSLQIGIPFTTLTFSAFATNTLSGTIEGRSVGAARTRYGIQATVPIPAGSFFGWFVPREVALESVQTEAVTGQPARLGEIDRYLFLPKVIQISAGETVEWTNRDGVIHTVSADDGAWDSGAIRPGATTRIRFSEPGRYPYHCGPHPFMKGIVIVR